MDAPRSPSRPGGVVATPAVAGITAATTQTLVTPLLAELPTIVHTTASDAAWVITAALVVGAVCVPVFGRLGDLAGKRRMLLVCAVPLVAGSVVCALSSSVVPMIAGRCLQGMGMVPLGIALVSASMGIGGGLGLPVAAAVAQYASWRALFWGCAAPAWSACRSLSPRAPTGAGVRPPRSACSPPPSWYWPSGAGVGLAYGAMPALIMSSVPQSETAAANGFNTLMRSLGTSVGAAVTGVVLAQLTTTMGGHTVTSESGFRTGPLVGCGIALIAVAVAAAIPAAPAPGPRTPARPPEPTPDTSPPHRGTADRPSPQLPY